MNRQPILEDSLLVLRPLKESDFEDLFAVAKDPLIWKQHQNKDRYQRAAFTRFFRDAMDSCGALIVTDKFSNKVIGSSRYQAVENVVTAIEIGWTILSRYYWGGKYNNAMKKLMINHALESLEHVLLHIDKANIRSQKAAMSIGAVRVMEPHLDHLLSKSSSNWTYRVSRDGIE